MEGKSMSNPNEERKHSNQDLMVERIQTGVRMEKQMVKVLKGLAEYLDLSLGDLLEGIVLHAFAGKAPLSRRRKRMTRFSIFSVLDYYDDDSRTIPALYEQLLDQIVVAEQLGFDAYWIGEHPGYLN